MEWGVAAATRGETAAQVVGERSGNYVQAPAEPEVPVNRISGCLNAG